MSNLLSHDAAALKMLMNGDLYLIREESPLPVKTDKAPQKQEIVDPQKDIQGKANYTEFNYLGENNKYFLVLIEDQIHTNLKAAHKEMLLKILQAKKMDLRDVAIVNVQKYPDVTFAQLKAFFVCNRLLILGIPAINIGLPSGSLNQVKKINEVKILTSYSLTEMENDKAKKREFWNVMKEF